MGPPIRASTRGVVFSIFPFIKRFNYDKVIKYMSVSNFANKTFSNIFAISKIFIVIFTLYVLVFGFFQFGFGSSINGKVANCPFSNHSMSICKMNPIEHIQEWQNMLLSLPIRETTPTLLFFLFFGLLGMLMWRNSFSHIEIKNLYTSFFSRYNFHIQDPIKHAFSRGILNPKLF